MRLLKSHENGLKIQRSSPSTNRRSTEALFPIRTLAVCGVGLCALFFFAVQSFSRGEIRLEGLGIRFEALLDSQPKKDKAPAP